MKLSRQEKAKITKGLCITPFCRNRLAPNRRYCYKCIRERYKEAHPVEYAYGVLRRNVRRRAKKFEKRYGYVSSKYRFDLTLEEFRKFCYKTELLKGRGITAESYHIDRIDEEKGYTLSNIQVLTNRDNVKKARAHKRKILIYDYQTKQGNYRVEAFSKENPKDDCPF